MTLNSESGPVPASMVERMARAMAGEIIKNGSGKGGYDNLSDGSKMLLANICIAALREMREPTEVMGIAAEAKAQEMADASPAMQRWHGDELITAAIDAEIAAYEAGR